MKINLMQTSVLACALTIAASGAAEACSPGYFSGAATPEGQREFSISVQIECSGDVVSGQVQTPFATDQISGGVATGDEFRVESDAGGRGLVVEARRDGETWRGTFAAGTRRGSVTLVRGAPPSPDVVRTDLTPAEWTEDLGQIEQEIINQHANAFHTINEDEWREAVHALRQRLPSMTGPDIAVAFRELVARIGDAHTSVQLPPGLDRLPLGMFWFGDELRIVRVGAGHEELLGAEVLKVGGQPIAEVHRRVARLWPPENAWAPISITPYFMVRSDVLRYYQLADLQSGATLRVRTARGQVRTVDLSFAPPVAADGWRYIGGEPPIWSRMPDEQFYWTQMPDNVLYVNFRGYDGLRAHGRELLAEIDQNHPSKLIIDMRDNGGGDQSLFRRSLLPAIQEREWLNRADVLFVLTGREMFSAAMTNAADLKLQTNATLVGEPIGERPNSYQELVNFTLANSHLRVGVSTQYYEALPGQGDPEAVTPDVDCPPTWARFSRGQDDALECVLQQSGGR